MRKSMLLYNPTSGLAATCKAMNIFLTQMFLFIKN